MLKHVLRKKGLKGDVRGVCNEKSLLLSSCPESLIAFATAAQELLTYVCVRNVGSDAETTE